MIRKISLFARLTVGFLLLLLVTLGIGGIAIYKIDSLSDITQNLHDHPFTVSNSLLEFRGNIHAIRADVQAALSDTKGRDIAKLANEIEALDREAQKHIELAGDRYLGPKQDFQKLTAAYAEWRNGAFATVSLLKEGKREEALQHQREKVIPQRERLLAATDRMIEFAGNRGAHFMTEARAERDRSLTAMVVLLLTAAGACITLSLLIIRSISAPIERLITLSRDLALGKDMEEQAVPYSDEIGQLELSFNAIIAANNQVVGQARTIAGGTYTEPVRLRSEKDALGISLRRMTSALADRERESQAENWMKTGQNELGEKMRSNQEVDALATAVVSFVAERLHAQVGCLYLLDGKAKRLRLQGTYACAAGDVPAELALGEGLVGQAAADGRTVVLADIPSHYLRISSAVGETLPGHLLVAPFLFEERLLGVLELGSLDAFDEVKQTFVSRICTILGSGFNIALARREMQQLLDTTLKQAEELRVQQEELAAINEELEEQTQALTASEQLLQEQQEELRASNEELEEKTLDLELQREKILQNNLELETAQREMEQQALELERASRYKSDFLSNMSHELRTPLNSLLILARDLMDNRSGNLVAQQVESAEVIHRSGMDLLGLINDILDLAKIEAGRMDLFEEHLSITELAAALKARFMPQAGKKRIELRVTLEEGTPETIHTDRQRLEQILNNLVSNAVKFTEQGSVEVKFIAHRVGHRTGDCRGRAGHRHRHRGGQAAGNL